MKQCDRCQTVLLCFNNKMQYTIRWLGFFFNAVLGIGDIESL